MADAPRDPPRHWRRAGPFFIACTLISQKDDSASAETPIEARPHG
jgi:hypothetical protein